jgi:hypothetical protein
MQKTSVHWDDWFLAINKILLGSFEVSNIYSGRFCTTVPNLVEICAMVSKYIKKK